jgi:hypothetical protein
MSKYDPLWQYIKDNNQPTLILSFDEIKNILGFKIDHSFLNYKKELTNFGYQVDKISLKEKKIHFTKVIY